MSNRIKKKFIDNNAVDGSKLRLLNSESVRAKKKNSEDDVSLFKLNEQDQLEFQVIPKLSQNPSSDDDLVRKAFLDNKVAQEASLRESADMALDARLDALEADPVTKSYVDSKDLSEKSDREAADAALDARLDALEADPVTKAYVDGKDSIEKSEREAADAALDGRLDVLEADPVTKAYVDSKDSAQTSAREQAISDLKGSVSSGYDTLKKIEDKIKDVISNTDPAALDSLSEIVSAFQNADGDLLDSLNNLSSSSSSAIAAEQAAREAADMALDGRLDALEADAVTKAYVDSKDSAEKSNREAADAALDGRLDVLEQDPTTKAYVDSKVLAINNDMDSLDAYAQDIRGDLDQEILDRASAVSAEETARIAGDAALSSSLSVEQSARQAADSALDSKITTKFNESKSYTDTKIADLVNSAPAVLDTLKELSDALGGDANFATSVANQIAASSNSVGDKFKKEAFVVDAGMISAGSIDLSSKAFEGSIVLTNARLMMLSGEDYSVSIVAGKTRITFMGSMLPMGEEALEIGDKLRVSYLEDVRV